MSRDVSECIQSICFVHTGAMGDRGAFERAQRMAVRTAAELHIVAVAEQPPAGVLRVLAACGSSMEEVSEPHELAAEVEELVAAARQRGIETRGEVLHGSVFLEIARKVIRDGDQLLIKAAQPSRGIHRVLFGHVDRQLIRKCPGRVWIEKPSIGRTHDRIFAAVDPDPFPGEPDFDATREALNTAILEFALLLAETEEAEIHVVHAWPFYLEHQLRTRAGMTEQAVEQAASAIRGQHEEALHALLTPFQPHIAQVNLVKGNPGEEISKLAANEMADVVVMGTMCRTGISGLVIGNTAETLLDQVDCSVVALKPQGFVSPIQA